MPKDNIPFTIEEGQKPKLPTPQYAYGMNNVTDSFINNENKEKLNKIKKSKTTLVLDRAKFLKKEVAFKIKQGFPSKSEINYSGYVKIEDNKIQKEDKTVDIFTSFNTQTNLPNLKFTKSGEVTQNIEFLKKKNGNTSSLTIASLEELVDNRKCIKLIEEIDAGYNAKYQEKANSLISKEKGVFQERGVIKSGLVSECNDRIAMLLAVRERFLALTIIQENSKIENVIQSSNNKNIIPENAKLEVERKSKEEAEEEARKKAELEAEKVADAEKAKVEEDARKKAEEDARKKAEEEAKRETRKEKKKAVDNNDDIDIQSLFIVKKPAPKIIEPEIKLGVTPPEMKSIGTQTETLVPSETSDANVNINPEKIIPKSTPPVTPEVVPPEPAPQPTNPKTLVFKETDISDLEKKKVKPDVVPQVTPPKRKLTEGEAKRKVKASKGEPGDIDLDLTNLFYEPEPTPPLPKNVPNSNVEFGRASENPNFKGGRNVFKFEEKNGDIFKTLVLEEGKVVEKDEFNATYFTEPGKFEELKENIKAAYDARKQEVITEEVEKLKNSEEYKNDIKKLFLTLKKIDGDLELEEREKKLINATGKSPEALKNLTIDEQFKLISEADFANKTSEILDSKTTAFAATCNQALQELEGYKEKLSKTLQFAGDKTEVRITGENLQNADIEQTLRKDGTMHRKIDLNEKGEENAVYLTRFKNGAAVENDAKLGVVIKGDNPNPQPFIEYTENGEKKTVFYLENSEEFLAKHKVFYPKEDLNFYNEQGEKISIKNSKGESKAFGEDGNELEPIKKESVTPSPNTSKEPDNISVGSNTNNISLATQTKERQTSNNVATKPHVDPDTSGYSSDSENSNASSKSKNPLVKNPANIKSVCKKLSTAAHNVENEGSSTPTPDNNTAVERNNLTKATTPIKHKKPETIIRL